MMCKSGVCSERERERGERERETDRVCVGGEMREESKKSGTRQQHRLGFQCDQLSIVTKCVGEHSDISLRHVSLLSLFPSVSINSFSSLSIHRPMF